MQNDEQRYLKGIFKLNSSQNISKIKARQIFLEVHPSILSKPIILSRLVGALATNASN